MDIDTDKGGAQTFDALDRANTFPHTRSSTTQSGGVHRIYALPPGVFVEGSAGKLGSGLDIRSCGNLIVAPGSLIEDRPYRWNDDDPVTVAPQWLIDLCGAAKPRDENVGKRLMPEDEISIELAERYLDKYAPDAVLGEIDNKAFSVAAKLYDFAVLPSQR